METKTKNHIILAVNLIERNVTNHEILTLVKRLNDAIAFDSDTIQGRYDVLAMQVLFFANNGALAGFTVSDLDFIEAAISKPETHRERL